MRLGLSIDIADSSLIQNSIGNPLRYANQYGLMLWQRASRGITLGGQLRATAGTSVPTLTISGTPSTLLSLAVECTSVAGGTALGQALVRWSFNDGASFSASVATAASINIGNGLTLACAAGTYATNQRWSATVSAWADQSGQGNHAVQLTPANQPVFRLSSYGGHAGVDWLTGPTGMTLVTQNISLATFSFLLAIRGDASAGHPIVHNVDAGNGAYLFRTGPSNRTDRGGVVSARTATTWADGVRRTIGETFDGTHAGDILYSNGAAVAGTTVVGNNPGAVAVNGPIRLGANQTGGSVFRGLLHEVQVWSKPLPPSIMAELHGGIVSRSPGAI